MNQQTESRGFSLIEILISLLIIMVLFLGIYSLIVLSLKLSKENRLYTAAIEIANQKMEEIRNLPYNDVGTVHGSPAGTIPEFQNITQEANYTIHTTVVFYDDPFDGTLDDETDVVFTDYKIITIDVSWQGRFGAKSVILFTKIIPNTEETSSGYGLLKISTVDSSGSPIAAATVHVVNNALDPALDASYQTNSQGNLSLPVLPALDSYEVTVSKIGYSTEKTYAKTAENPNPTKSNYSIFEGQKTEDSFAIDALADDTLQLAEANLPNNYQVNSLAMTNCLTPHLAIDGTAHSYFIWQNKISDVSSEIYLQKFNITGSKLWTEDKQLGTGSSPDIAALDSGKLFAAWQDDSLGDNDIYFTGLDSSGNNLFFTQMVNSGGSGSEQTNPHIAVAGRDDAATTTIVWQSNQNGNWDIHAQSYDASGNRQWPNDLVVAQDGADETAPAIAALANGDFLVTWSKYDSSGQNKNDIYAQKYNKFGAAQWASSVILVQGTDDEGYSSVTFDENANFYLVYNADDGSKQKAYLAKFDQAGNEIWKVNVSLENDNYNRYNPVLAYQDNAIYVAWTDQRDDNEDVYLQKYSTAGVAQWPEDFRLNATTEISSQSAVAIALTSDGDKIAVWQDNRSGSDNIYTASFSDFPSETSLANVSVLVTGTKKIGENPVIYKFSELFISNANGNISLPLEWDTPGYTITLDSGYSGQIISSQPEMPIAVMPGENRSFKLYFK